MTIFTSVRALRPPQHDAGPPAGGLSVAPHRHAVDVDRVDAGRRLLRPGEGGGVADPVGIEDHQVGRRAGGDDAAALLGGAIERAWAVGVPSLAPLAPLASALVRGHMLRCFVPAYSEFTLAEERRLPPPSAGLPPVLPLAPFDLSLPPLVLPSGGGAPAAALQRAFWIEMIENGVED